MRRSFFMGSPWAPAPIRPIRMGQESCPIDGPCPVPGTTEPTSQPEPTPSPVPTTPQTPQDQQPASGFPVVPVAIGAGALVLLAVLARG